MSEIPEISMPAPEVWGFMEDGLFVPLPIPPMAHLGPPPFDVTLPGGEVRHVIMAENI